MDRHGARAATTGSSLTLTIPEHDVPPGRLDRCQITGSSDLFEVMDLGHQAPCDSMLTKEMLGEPETTYPLRLMLCPESGLAQLDYVVEGKTIYHLDYPYRSGISRPLAEYQRAFAAGVVEKLGIAPRSLCVDIGSNDGTLLTGFRTMGMRVLGVEPTNIARIAEDENGIETIQAYFDEPGARDIARLLGPAAIVTATNVFAHMADLGEVCRGIAALLADDGVFITESHYLLDVLNKNQFDTIYHEHIRTYSLKALVRLFPYYGLEVFDVQRADRYGGNIRVYVARTGRRKVAAAVGELLRLEEDAGLFEEKTWADFRKRIARERDRFMEYLWQAKTAGKSIAAQACPGRCATLLNYYGVTPALLPYIGEQLTSLKIGLYLPGSHIPVVPGTRLVEEQPDIVIVNAWHYLEPVTTRLRSEGVRSQFVTALPEFTVL
jgi:hypothetical protein